MNWVPSKRILTTNLWNSEFSNSVANAMLAQRVISLSFHLSAASQGGGKHVRGIACHQGDSRSDAEFLGASVGRGGSCFQKDILALNVIKYHGMAVDECSLIFSNTPDEAVDGAHAILILMEWMGSSSTHTRISMGVEANLHIHW